MKALYEGHWYDLMGQERSDTKALPLGDSLLEATNRALQAMPDSRLVVHNCSLDWSLISVDGNKRLLVCKREGEV